jgi:hypothetical protein
MEQITEQIVGDIDECEKAKSSRNVTNSIDNKFFERLHWHLIIFGKWALSRTKHFSFPIVSGFAQPPTTNKTPLDVYNNCMGGHPPPHLHC